MKILMFNWRDIKNPAHGGAEVLTHEIAKRLVAKGHEFTLFAAAFSGCKKEEIVDGVRIVRGGGQYSVYWQAFRHYKKHFQGKFDVVIDQINTIPFFTPFFVKEKKFSLVHQLCREVWFYEKALPVAIVGYLLEPIWLRLYRNVPAIAVSNSTKQDLKDRGFKSVSVISEGINFRPLDKIPEKEPNTFIFVARLKKAKRPDHAIRAVALAKEKIPKIRLWVVGSGEKRYVKHLKALAMENNLGNSVKFCGRVSQKKRNELMGKAQAILVTSVREGWGLIVTEANACGTPAIGYNVHGLKDSIKDGKTGLLTEEKPEAMANVIIRILDNKKIRQKLSKNSLKDSKKFEWITASTQFIKAIK